MADKLTNRRAFVTTYAHDLVREFGDNSRTSVTGALAQAETVWARLVRAGLAEERLLPGDCPREPGNYHVKWWLRHQSWGVGQLLENGCWEMPGLAGYAPAPPLVGPRIEPPKD